MSQIKKVGAAIEGVQVLEGDTIVEGKVTQKLPVKKSYEEQMGSVQAMANDDPKRVAQVMKTWVDNT